MENTTMKQFLKLGLAGALALGMGTNVAFADNCSGHSHDDATVGGAVGGGLIGGLASHSVAGGVVGAVAGGLIGNSIARNSDCNHRVVRRQHDSYYIDRDGHRHYYR
jgi:uncharacterized protein YcfJ